MFEAFIKVAFFYEGATVQLPSRSDLPQVQPGSGAREKQGSSNLPGISLESPKNYPEISGEDSFFAAERVMAIEIM